VPIHPCCAHQIGFFRGDVLGLLDDIAALKPTIFVSVPRLWNRIHDRVAAVRAWHAAADVA
jgi:long-subunit acyl-CoA synthetase (AMP-forming)